MATLVKSQEQVRQSLAAQQPWPVADDVFTLAHAQIVHVLIVLLSLLCIEPTLYCKYCSA